MQLAGGRVRYATNRKACPAKRRYRKSRTAAVTIDWWRGLVLANSAPAAAGGHQERRWIWRPRTVCGLHNSTLHLIGLAEWLDPHHAL